MVHIKYTIFIWFHTRSDSRGWYKLLNLWLPYGIWQINSGTRGNPNFRLSHIGRMTRLSHEANFRTILSNLSSKLGNLLHWILTEEPYKEPFVLLYVIHLISSLALNLNITRVLNSISVISTPVENKRRIRSFTISHQLLGSPSSSLPWLH